MEQDNKVGKADIGGTGASAPLLPSFHQYGIITGLPVNL